jgi:hypothetical protein
MANKNDERILLLKEQIQAKKDKLGKITRFTPVTNCSLELDGVRFNLNVLDQDKLIQLAVKINAYIMSAKDLGYTFKIGTYTLEEWLTDIKAKLDILSKKDEEKSLTAMEAKLAKMLSDEKQVELELDEIADLLK